jgi:hypothetical protein
LIGVSAVRLSFLPSESDSTLEIFDGMNAKRLILACLAVFIFIFGYEWVFHGRILKGTYLQTGWLWRSESEMMERFGWLAGGQLLLSVIFCLIYALSERSRVGVAQGIGYGLLMGLLLTAPTLITYTVQPMPLNLIGAWIAGGIIKLTVAGAILGAIYRPKAKTAV